MSTQYFVKDGHTLGYVHESQPHMFGVLMGNPFKGGHNWLNGPVSICPSDKLVPATLHDFEVFRVDPKGYNLQPAAK